MRRRWLIVGAALALLLTALQAFLPLLGPSGDFGSFMDETQSAQVALNFFTHLHYSIELWKPYAGAFYPEMSIGLLSSWPAAVGWGLGGDLLASRIATILYCLGLCLAVGYCATRMLVASERSIALAVSCLGCAVALLVAPGVTEIIVHAQGEFSGAAWLGLGYLLLSSRPRIAAVVLGLCVWHTKFIYLPFALAGLAWSACAYESTLARRARFFVTQLALLMMPLLVWSVIIMLQIGPDGFVEWAARRFNWYARGNSGLNGAPIVHGLQSRLVSPNLEWSRYSRATKVRILALLFAPCGLLSGAILRRWSHRERRPALDLLQLALVCTVVAFAWWYFYWNQFMWVRHLEPALLVGFAVLAYFGLLAVSALSARKQAWIAAAVCVVTTLAALSQTAAAVPVLRAWPLAGSVARTCHSGVPWQMGPWPRCMRFASTIIRPGTAPPSSPANDSAHDRHPAATVGSNVARPLQPRYGRDRSSGRDA